MAIKNIKYQIGLYQRSQKRHQSNCFTQFPKTGENKLSAVQRKIVQQSYALINDKAILYEQCIAVIQCDAK